MKKGTAKKVVKASEIGTPGVDTDAVVPVSLRLSRPLYERLRLLAFETRRPMTEFVVRGVEMVLEAEQRAAVRVVARKG